MKSPWDLVLSIALAIAVGGLLASIAKVAFDVGGMQ